ncbi:hypothetical protein [Paenibacillus sp. R14(2021)]|uniref:hypothetical protein n=1 Tax=Paenibacillus sp. R14(2021) TaxID=2859228 RepID=UPI001C61178F|nr:hypothetical protein [Paenibacillus sp. R14(2021)]
MNIVYSTELHLPEDKLPASYAQIVEGISTMTVLLDHQQTLLFVQSPEECEAIEAFAADYNVHCERGAWLLLPPEWTLNDRSFIDYGLITRSDNRFLNLDLAAVAVVGAYSAAAEGSSELESALEQAEEHAVAWLTQEDGRRLLAVDRHQLELIAGIARAYRCTFDIFLAGNELKQICR